MSRGPGLAVLTSNTSPSTCDVIVTGEQKVISYSKGALDFLFIENMSLKIRYFASNK